MKRLSFFSRSLVRIRPLRECAAIWMVFLTLFYAQLAAAQTSSCTIPPPPTTPPSNTYPTLPNLTLNISNQSVTISSLSLLTNLATQPTVASSSSGVSPIVVTQGNGPCSASYPVLIQNWCSTTFASDVLQFQGEVAQEYLSLFQIPAADGPTALQIIASRANTKLLNSYFGFMLGEIEALLNADPSTLTTHQGKIVAWFNSLVWQHEKDLYSAAEQEKAAFLNNPCGYIPDPDLAAQYNLQFGNINQCQGAGAILGNSQVPPGAYFLAVGLKKSYGAAVSGDPDGAVLNYGMLAEKDFFLRLAFEMGTGLKTAWSDAEAQLVNVGIAAGTGLGSFAAAELFFSSGTAGKTVLPYAYRRGFVPTMKTSKYSADSDVERALTRAGNATNAVETAVEGAEGGAGAEFSGEDALVGLAGDFADAALPTTLATAGPAAVVAIFVAILSESIDQLMNYEQAKQDYAFIDQLQESLQTQPANGAFFIGTDKGEYKLAATLAAVALPLSIASSIPSENTETNPNHAAFRITDSQGHTTINNTVSVKDWNLLSQSVLLKGPWLLESEQGGVGNPVVSETPVIHYLDWNGRQWWAARFGDAFLAVKNGYEHQDEGDQFQDTGACGDGTPSPMSDDSLLQAQQANSGVKNAYCSSFVTHKLHVKDNNGNNLVLEIGATPGIGPGAQINAVFQPGQSVRFTVPIIGYPAPSVSATNLLPGFTFDKTSDGAVEIIDNNLTASQTSTGTITLTLTNPYGLAKLPINVTENVGSAIPTITGPSQLNLQGGQPFSATFRILGAQSYQLDSINYSSGLSIYGIIPLNVSGTVTGLKVSVNADDSYTVSGVPVLQSNYVDAAPGAPVSGAITISASGGFWNSAIGTSQAFSKTQSFPFTYTPSVDPVYAIKNVIMYTGQDNEVLIQPITPTAEPLFYPLNITGDAGCADQIILLANPNDASFIFRSRQQIPSVKHCFVTFTAQDAGDLLPQFVNIGQPSATFPVTFLTIPKFTNISNPVFPVGLPVNFPLTLTSAGAVSFTGSLPQGLNFQPNGTSGGTITGTPAAGSGGEYKVTFSAQSPDGSSSQILDIKVPEAPKFTSTAFVNVPAGQNYTFNVTTTGYPNLSSDPCAGMSFALQPIGNAPPVTSQTTNLAFDSTGTLKLTFPNLSAGTEFQIGIHASNSAGTAPQLLTVIYHVPGDATGDGVVNCTDVAAINAYLGQPAIGSLGPLDLNNDGVIDQADLALVNANLPKGTSCPSMSMSMSKRGQN